MTGSLPFPQKEPSALIAAIMMREFEPSPVDVPKDLQNVVAKALAKTPEKRYATAIQMREGLRLVSHGRTVAEDKSRPPFLSVETPPTQRSESSFGLGENETVVRPTPSFGVSEKRKGKRDLILATIGLILVSAIGLGGYFLLNPLEQKNSRSNQTNSSNENKEPSRSLLADNANLTIDSNVQLSQSSISPTPTPTSYAGTYKYSDNDSYGRLGIKEIGDIYPKPFSFVINTGLPGCVGEIKGTAKWIKQNSASFRRKNDNYDPTNEYNRPFCQLTFTFLSDRKVAVKENEYGCMYYYGVRGCGFNGTYTK